ncbi:MAG TPA: iron-containing redox enzyme family protein [Acidobacteriaceae bacterium]|jgi:pyrroloquinoline-quinone synthase
MTHQEFWTRVQDELGPYDLLKHPFYQAWSAGELTQDELSVYGRQYLNHVAAFPAYLTALHARLPEGETRRAVLRNAADEEVHGTSHADLWREFVRGMENGAEGEPEAILPEMAALVETFAALAREGSPMSALGAFYAYESQVPRIAEEKLAGLKKFYGADDAACAYFQLHRTADVHHAAVWRRLMEQEMEATPGGAEQALDGVRQGAQALWRALDGIEAERLAARNRSGHPAASCCA